MTREERAEEFAVSPFNYHSAGPSGLATRGRYDGFLAGWDAALKHDERVKALVEALELACNHLGVYGSCAVCDDSSIHCDHGRSIKALKKWRGDE